MLKTLATVLCFILFTGVFAVAAQAGDLELAVAQPRHVDVSDTMLGEWHRQLAAGKMICPTLQELYASRQQLAREAVTSPNPTEAYKIALTRQAEELLAPCRAQFEWVASLLKQTPEGRAYLARIVAYALNQLRLNADPNGVWAVFDAGPAPGGFGGPQNCSSGCVILNREQVFDLMFTPTDRPLTTSERASIAQVGAGTLSVLLALGVITGPVWATIIAVISLYGAAINAAQELGVKPGPSPDREPER